MNKSVSEVQKDIEKLPCWLSNDYVLPKYKNLVIAVDDGLILESNSDLRIPIKKGELYAVEEYSDDYSIRKNSGYSWINLHCAGMYDDSLVIVIEYPIKSEGVKDTSINMSGPNNLNTVSSIEWNFEKSYKLVD